MKKIVFLVVLAISLININISFALTKTQEEAIKPQVEKVFKIFENNLIELTTEKQITTLDVVIEKIDNILLKEKNEINNFVLSHLRYLLNEKLEYINNDDSNVLVNSEEELLNDIFQSYCRIGYLINLYDVAGLLLMNGYPTCNANASVDFWENLAE